MITTTTTTIIIIIMMMMMMIINMIIITIIIILIIIIIIIIIIAMRGAMRDFLQSPHCAANCLQHVRSSGLGAIVCKARANTSSAYHVQPAACHLVRRDSSAIKFDRVEIAFILPLFYWLKPLTDEGGEETWYLHVPKTATGEAIERNRYFPAAVRIVTSAFLYACETWTLTAEMERRIQTFEMRCYRRIFCISFRDRITNEDVRNRVRAAIGPHGDLLSIVKTRKLRWYVHVTRATGLANTIMQGTQYQAGGDEADQRNAGTTTSRNGRSCLSPRH